MVVLLVDGDYLLSGFKPTSDADVREAVERMEESMTQQLLTPSSAGNLNGGAPPTYHARIEVRVALFSSALINSLPDKQRQNVISTFRKLRYQTTVLESVSGRHGSPVDSALCTKSIMIAMMPTAAMAAAEAAGVGAAQVFCFVTPNAYIVSALDLITQRGCEAIFAVYQGDEVAEELLGYVSSSYGSGIATMPKKEGVSFIPNTEAASAALAALQQEGKDLPLAVLQELRIMQQSLTTRRRPSTNGSFIAGGTGDDNASILDENRRRVQQEQSKVAPPPPLPGVPSPFDDDDKKPSAPPDTDSVPATPQATTPYVYHGDDDLVPMPSVKPTAAPPTETLVLTTATSPPDLVQSAVPPTSAPPASASAYVNAPPAEVTAEPAVSTQLPASWAVVYDKQRRRHFYTHRDAAGHLQATWEHPLGPSEQRTLDGDIQAWYEHELKKLPPKQQQQQQPVTPSPAPAADAGAALPPGWEERIDPRSGRKFYINHNTKETTWNPPTAPASTPQSRPQQLEPLPPFWDERIDPRDGRTYYVNLNTMESTWTRPTRHPTTAQQQPAGADEWETRIDAQGRPFYVNHRLKQTSWTKPTSMQAAKANPQPAPLPQQQPQQPEPLPPFWEERVDPRNGRTYYVNHSTRETTWVRPSRATGQA